MKIADGSKHFKFIQELLELLFERPCFYYCSPALFGWLTWVQEQKKSCKASLRSREGKWTLLNLPETFLSLLNFSRYDYLAWQTKNSINVFVSWLSSLWLSNFEDHLAVADYVSLIAVFVPDVLMIFCWSCKVYWLL